MFAIQPHILVIDDDTRLRELLQRYLSSNGFYITSAADTQEARTLLGYFRYDLLVLDVMMPGETGLEFAHWLRTDDGQKATGRRTPILMLSARGEAQDRIAGLRHGVDDYLSKPFEPQELVLRIEAILARVHESESRQVLFGPYRFDTASGTVWKEQEQLYLTSGEATLLQLLIAHAGQPLSREALFAKLGLTGNERTVDVQITRLRRKLEPNSKQPHYIRTLRGKGYAFFAG